MLIFLPVELILLFIDVIRASESVIFRTVPLRREEIFVEENDETQEAECCRCTYQNDPAGPSWKVDPIYRFVGFLERTNRDHSSVDSYV